MTETTELEEIEATSYKKELIIGGAVVFGLVAIFAVIVAFIYISTPKVDYQPTVACEALTLTEAQDVLGTGAMNSTANEPVLSGNTATSKCGYADGAVDTEKMRVAAIIVRSGINDKGIQQNKTEFAAGTPTKAVEIVKNIGDSAYFNQSNGQLNILKGRTWIILSYGLGSAPEANTLEDTLTLAQKVLN